MPRSIADIRKSAGGLENLTDEDILQATYQKYKAYYPSLDEYAAEIGYGGAGRSLTGSRISAGIDQYQANLLGLGGAVSRAVGAEGLGESFDRRREANEGAAAYAAQRARDLGGVEDWRQITGPTSALNYAGGLAAQSLPYAGEAVAGALTGGAALAGTAARMGLGAAAARTAGAVAASYPSAVGDILSNQREAGGERLGAAAVGGVPYAALNAFGMEGQMARGLRPLVQGEGGALRRMAVGVPTSALGEGLSETGQELINQGAGRMAVNPNETLFNPEANRRYIDSFVGGATLGGVVGGIGSIRSTQLEDGSLDLTGSTTPSAPTPAQPTPKLGFNPLAGTPIVFPDGSVTLGSEQELLKRYGANQTTTALGLNQPYINGDLVNSPGGNVRKPVEASAEPMDLTVANPAETAARSKLARDPRSYELRDTFGVIPTPSSLQLYSDIQASGIPADSDVLTSVWKYASDKPMTPKRLEKAQQLLDAAIIESRKGAANVSATPTAVPQPTAGMGAGGPVVQGGVGVAGPSAAINVQPSAGPTIAGAPAGQAQPISTPGGQQAAPVIQGSKNGPQASKAKQTKAQGQTTTTRGAAGTTPLVDTSEDALEIARATGNAGEIEAMREDEAGMRADRTALTDDDVNKIVGTRFIKSKNAKRDATILNAYLTALRANAGTDKAAIQNAIGDKYGITAVTVRKIGNPSKLVEAGAELGFSPEQVLDLFQVDDNTKAQFTEIGKIESEIKDLRKAYNKATDTDKRKEVADRMAALSERITKIKEKASDEKAAAFSAGLQEAGVSGAEGETAGFGFDTEREWSRVEGESKLASTVLELSNQIESLQEAAAKLDAQGQSEAADAARNAIAARQTKIDALLAEVQKPAAPVSKAAPDVAEARKRWNDAGRDLTKLSVEDLQVLQGYTASINNKALSNKIAAEISSRGAPQETANAVQVESPTGVSVQPKTEAGQGVGTEVRGAEKPAGEGEAQILTPQEQYEKVTAGFPVPAWADLTSAQQSSLTDLARRDQLNLAAVNRFVSASEKGESADDTAMRVLRMQRGDTVEVIAGELKFEGSITDEASLRRFPGVESALAHYEGNELRHVIDGVELWMVAPDTVDFDAAILMVDGKQTLAVRSGVLVDTERADWSMHHELGHIADDAFRVGGIYSSAPELNMMVRNGAIRPMGSVISEIVDHIDANPESDFARTMAYPLNLTLPSTKNLTSGEVRMEVFAQLWAMYNRRSGRDYLADNLPLTFDFMELNDEAAKQDQGSADIATGAAASPSPQQNQANRGAQGVTPAVLRIASPSEGLIAQNISKLPKAAQQPVRKALGAIGDVTGKGLDYLVFTSDLVNRATKAGIPSAKKFVDLIGKSKAEARENEIAVEKIADMYALVPEKDRGTGDTSVNRFLFDSTREGKWGYGQYRDAVMGDRFDALSKESQDFVKAVFDHGTTVLAQKKKVVLDSTNSEYDAMIAVAQADVAKAVNADDKAKAQGTLASLKAEKAATLKRFQTLFKIRDGIPYAPIKRNGNYAVIAKSQEYRDAELAEDSKKIAELEGNSDHYHVSFTDGKWEGRTLQQQLIDQGAFADVQLAERDSVVDEMFSGHSALSELTAMRSRVDAKVKDDDKSASKMLNLISQMYLEALAEGSARKSEMRRRGVEGEVDMIRSFAQQGRADANFMASVKYNPQVQDALQEMRKQSKAGDRTRKSEIFNELAKRYMQSMEYSPRPWLNKLTRMSSIYYLATSPAYYLQNLTQPWMMSVPAMAGNHDYTAASGALFKAYTELGDVMKSAKLLKQQFDFAKVPADVRDAIQELVNRGKIDIGLDTEIGEFKVEGDGYFAGKISAADKALRLAVQKVESINRLSTAMAAYRLELAKTGSKQAAVDYADRILTETHGDYTSFNAPRAFNTSVGKVAFQFRKFQLIQIAFYAKLIKEALNGADRKAALKTLSFSLAHTGTLAGLMGMPGYAAISWAIGALLGDDDEPYDVTSEIRKAIGDEAVANLILKGAPTLVGADISGKVGAGNMLSIMPFSQADLSTTAGRAEALGTLVGGASLGMTSRMVDGLGLMLSGDWYRGIEQTVPKGVSDAMKAWRIANEGMTRRNGDVILPASEISTMDSLFQAIGISPVQQTTTYERQNAVKALTDTFQARTTEIKNQYVKADRANDAEAKAQARADWNKLQDAKARNGVPRKPMSDLMRAPAEQRKRERETVGGVPYTKATKKLAQQYSEM